MTRSLSTVVLALAAGALTTAANAGFVATAAPLDSGSGYGDRATVVYSGIPGPYSAFANATGAIGFDNYTTTLPGSTFLLESLSFVGNVTTVGGTLTFEFFDSASNFVTSFSGSLPAISPSIWTLTLTTPATVPTAGILQIRAAATTTGRWFLTTSAPSIGTNAVGVGIGSGLNPQRNNAFELTAVPAPAGLALAGLAGLFAGRRRR